MDLTDTRTAPLAAYIYQCSGAVRIREYLARADEMFAGKINPVEFMQALDQAMALSIILAVAKRVPSRRAQLINMGRIVQNMHNSNL